MSAHVVPVSVQVPSDPAGPVIADLRANALRVAYVARRDLARLPEAEWGFPGIYVLLADNGSGHVYVGQAVHLRKRLLQHRSKPKLEWSRAVAIKRDTSHGFNSAEIGYLEGRLAAELGAIPSVHVVEGLKNHDLTLPSHETLALDAILPSVFAALRLAGMDLLKDADLGDPGVKLSAQKSQVAVPGTVADLVGAGLLQAGSELHLRQGGKEATATVSTAGEVIVDGVAYASPSTAARTALGLQSSNGWRAWHVGDLSGPTLAQLRTQLQPAAGERAGLA